MNLLGKDVFLNGKVVMAGGGKERVSGHVMVAFPETLEAKSFLRWSQGHFGEDEQRAAVDWRNAEVAYQTEGVIDVLKRVNAFEECTCSTLTDVIDAVDSVLMKLRPDQQVHLAIQLFQLERDKSTILTRFAQEKNPPLSTFAPYVAFALRIELFYHIGVNASRISKVHRLDVTYLMYLPFCQVFVSTDWVHRDCAPLFISDGQSVVWGPELKAALKILNDRYSALPESKLCQSLFTIAPCPPLDVENLVTELWKKHGGGCLPPQGTREELKELVAFWQNQIPTLDEIAESGGNLSLTALPPDAVVLKRTSRKRRGSWWRVPEELRNPEPESNEQVLDFRNGASSENVVDQNVEVYILHNATEIESMPGCRTFVQDKKLHVDCAPPLQRRYTALVPNGAMFARSTQDDALGLFVPPSSELASLIRKLFEHEKI
ncbi:hypothetical protein SH668x_000044 [Planctomicrobium sp. SH668]|uniref:hypothetical protein n=1 Tax=Planctomicrobium sp. SH668 TaxID=3448126 RepID=UPI003F5BA7D0